MIFDISRPITETMAVYKNKDSMHIKHTWVSQMPEDNSNASAFTTNLHTGTHVDAPLHMIANGASIDQVDPSLYWGPCRVLDLTHLNRPIEAKDLEGHHLQAGERVLLKTRNSYEADFNPEFIYIEESAAQHIVDAGVKMVGIDAMSVERGKENHPTHNILLGAGLGVLEDVRLAKVDAGNYHLSAIPLHLVGMEASPVRALLYAADASSANAKADGYTYFPII